MTVMLESLKRACDPWKGTCGKMSIDPPCSARTIGGVSAKYLIVHAVQVRKPLGPSSVGFLTYVAPWSAENVFRMNGPVPIPPFVNVPTS